MTLVFTSRTTLVKETDLIPYHAKKVGGWGEGEREITSLRINCSEFKFMNFQSYKLIGIWYTGKAVPTQMKRIRKKP